MRYKERAKSFGQNDGTKGRKMEPIGMVSKGKKKGGKTMRKVFRCDDHFRVGVGGEQ